MTENRFGKGSATYIGCYTGKAYLKKILQGVLQQAELWGIEQMVAFPIIIKSGVNEKQKTIHYYFNYSGIERSQKYLHADSLELFSIDEIGSGKTLTFEPWDIKIFEEK